MAVFNEPQKWAQTLGKDADVVKIPDIAGDTDPSIDKIFPAVFSIPLARGGRAIPRSVLNGLFKLLGDWSFYQQNGGIASYSNTFDYAVGSFVKYNNELYLCIQANGASSTVKAPTDAKYWLRVALNNDLANYLPLAGGNLTGSLNIASSDGESILKLDSEQGSIYLDASSNIRGLFIKNIDNNSIVIVSIERDGTATFNGTAQHAFADQFGYLLGGIADAGTDYIRYSNGLQLCWGKYYTNPNPLTVTLPKPFKDTNYSVTVSEIDATSSVIIHGVLNVTASSFNVRTPDAGCTGNYIAIGLWRSLTNGI